MPAKAKPAVKRATRTPKPRTATQTKSATMPSAATRPRAKAKTVSAASTSPLVDKRIAALTGWRRDTLVAIRQLIREADPDVTEDCKWFKASNPLGVPVWSHDGILCTGEVYKEVVKLTFMRGAALDDPKRLFNSSLDGGTRRAIDIREGETLDTKALKALIKAAVAANLGG